MKMTPAPLHLIAHVFLAQVVQSVCGLCHPGKEHSGLVVSFQSSQLQAALSM